MYIPPDSHDLALTKQPTFKVAIQGPGGSGKTFSAMTFPNVKCLNYDNNLQAFHGRKDIISIDMWDDNFVDRIMKGQRGNTLDLSNSPANPRPNRRDATTRWLNENGPKFGPDDTLFIDSWSKLQDGFDIQENIEPHYNQDGKIDEFAFWASKKDWSRDVCELLGSFNCNVVVAFHEMRLTDKKGNFVDGKFVPLQEGKFVNKISLYFSEWLRSYFFPKGTPMDNLNPRMVSDLELKGDILTEDLGVWQTQSSIYCDCKTRIIGCPVFIKASYQELIKLYSAHRNNSVAPAV
jgi:hypothetical protein